MSARRECVCVCINTQNESLHSNFSILQDEKWRKWSLIQVQQMFTELIMDHTDFLSRDAAERRERLLLLRLGRRNGGSAVKRPRNPPY